VLGEARISGCRRRRRVLGEARISGCRRRRRVLGEGRISGCRRRRVLGGSMTSSVEMKLRTSCVESQKMAHFWCELDVPTNTTLILHSSQ